LSSRPLTLAYVGFAALGAAVLGAFVYDRTVRPAPVQATAGATTLPVTPASPQPPSPAVPARRPDFTLNDLDGNRHSLAEWDGKSLVINFWATWCAPCRHEIPLLNRIRGEYAAKGFEVVGIAVDFAEDVRAFTKDFPIRYPLLIGEEDGLEAARAFGVATMAFPFTAFTDQQGRVIAVRLGELHAAQAEAILGIVIRVNRGELTPESARAEIQAALERLTPPAPASAAPAPG
jgi:thiol-disulfide isomerase/thioredoxin